MRSPDARLRLALVDYLLSTRKKGPDIIESFDKYGMLVVSLETAFKDHWRKARS